jgi:hypothetical protein
MSQISAIYLRLSSILKNKANVIAASLIVALLAFITFSFGVLVGAAYYLWSWF